MPLFPSHLAAKMGEGALGRIGALSSTVSFGCYAPALLGVTYLSVIPPIRRATADFSNGCGRASYEVFSKHSLKICGFKAGLTCVKPSSMAALLQPKRGIEDWQNKTWQGNEDHRCRRPPWPPRCCNHCECDAH